jgi:hypothetical protein
MTETTTPTRAQMREMARSLAKVRAGLIGARMQANASRSYIDTVAEHASIAFHASNMLSDLADHLPEPRPGETTGEKLGPLCRRCGEPEGDTHEFGFRDHEFRHPDECGVCDGDGLTRAGGTCQACAGSGLREPAAPPLAPSSEQVALVSRLHIAKHSAMARHGHYPSVIDDVIAFLSGGGVPDFRNGCSCQCCDHSEGSDCACDCHSKGACSAAAPASAPREPNLSNGLPGLSGNVIVVAPREPQPSSEQQTHSLERTSPLGGPFVGMCVLCGMTGLPSGAALQPCANPDGVSSDSALIAAIEGSCKRSIEVWEPREPHAALVKEIDAYLGAFGATSQGHSTLAKLLDKCKAAILGGQG